MGGTTVFHKYLPGDTRERIKDLLSEAKMNQEELAEKLGISGSSLNRYISGQTEKLSTDNIVAMAKIFHVSTDFLLCLTDIPFKTNYDIEHLGLSVDAAKMLLKKEYDMDTLNILLTQPDFVLMVRQLTNLRQGTMEAGVEGMNQMIASTVALLTEYAGAYPSDRNAASVRGFRRNEYAGFQFPEAAGQARWHDEGDILGGRSRIHQIPAGFFPPADYQCSEGQSAHSY